MKTLSDEALIVSTSQNIHYHRIPYCTWKGYNIDGSYSPVEAFLDKRPIAFSVIISLVHDIVGYRVENAYYLNILLGLSCIVLIGYLGSMLVGKLGAALGMILMGGLPLLITYSHGAGFDVFHIFTILIALIAGLKWYQHEDNWSLCFFVFTGTILCFSRYEAPLYCIPIGATILLKWWSMKRIQLPWILLTVPLLMTLIPLQQKIFEIDEAHWQLASIPEADKVFSLKYFYPNLAGAISFFGDTSDLYPNSPLLTVMGFISFAFVFAKIISSLKWVKDVKNLEPFVWILFMGGILAHFALLLVYFFGKFDLGGMHRLGLPLYLFAVLVTLWFFRILSKLWIKQFILGLSVLGVLLYSVPVSMKHVYTNRYLFSAHSNWIASVADQSRNLNMLVVCFNPVFWTVEKIPAILFQTANESPEKLAYQLEKDGFDRILVIDRMMRNPESGDFEFAPKEKLESLVEGFETKVLKEKIISPTCKLRMSELVAVDVVKVRDSLTQLGQKNDEKTTTKSGKRFMNVKSIDKAVAELYSNLP